MTDRLRRASASLSLAATIAAAAWLAGPTLADAAVATSPTTATPTADATASSMASSLLTWLNADRVAIGLRPLRRDGFLVTLAGDRAAHLAGLGVLSHERAGGDIGSLLDARGVPWYGWSEDLGSTSVAWGTGAARFLYAMWRASPEHWATITSPALNYLGIGVALRAATGTTYASIVFTEQADLTPPVVAMTGARGIVGPTGTATVFTWRGVDPVLQTHTVGLRDFDVEYRVDGGEWRVIRSGTRTTSVTLGARPGGHSYWVRVRAHDRRGNLSHWSRALRVVVP